MFKKRMKMVTVFAVFFGLLNFLILPASFAADMKIGYVDLRRTFYEYEKAKTMEKDLNDATELRQKERTAMVEKITKLRDEAELLKGDARKKKDSDIEKDLVKLQEFDRDIRQEILTKRNDMFREVIDDIQKIVEDMGAKGGYDYIFDSRDIMYSNKDFDLTDNLLKQLNKK